MPTAAAIIIGDEILSGKFEDENGPWLVRRCRELGIDLKRISIISDDVTTIGDEVRRASAAYDYVFTTGGIGSPRNRVVSVDRSTSRTWEAFAGAA